MQLLGQVNFQIIHTFRESNKCADFLASFGCRGMKSSSFVGFDSCPHQLKGLVKMDRVGILSLRVRNL